MTHFRLATFQLDSIPDAAFRGCTDDSEWNGFATPRFDFETAKDVLKHSEPNGFSWRFAFDADAFYVAAAHDDDGADEMFAGETIVYSGEEMRVYPIGSGSWIWSEVED